jgi:hypothetical protein
MNYKIEQTCSFGAWTMPQLRRHFRKRGTNQAADQRCMLNVSVRLRHALSSNKCLWNHYIAAMHLEGLTRKAVRELWMPARLMRKLHWLRACVWRVVQGPRPVCAAMSVRARGGACMRRMIESPALCVNKEEEGRGGGT